MKIIKEKKNMVDGSVKNLSQIVCIQWLVCIHVAPTVWHGDDGAVHRQARQEGNSTG